MKNNNTLNEEIFGFLRSKGYEPTMLDTSGKEMPVASEAEVFQFKFKKDGEEYGTVTLSIDNQKLILYCNDKIVNSPSYEKDATDVSWGSFRTQLKRLAFSYGATDIVLRNSDHLKHDMAKRENMKKDNVSEGYYPMGKKSSYNDSVPSVKIVLQHSRSLEEGERRYRAIEKIFIENMQGERFAIPTKKPGLARVYARHIAEGGTPYDEGGKHINSLVEEYTKMAGFVRATKNGTFNESVQSLISEGVNHYQSIRETLHKLAGHRGYHAYFESWSPSLMEDSQDVADLSEMFSNNNLDPRIESAMPILSKLRKKVEEMTEVSELSEWADAIIEGDGGQEAVNPVGIPEEGMNEGSLNELSKATLKSYSNERGATIHADQRDAGGARTMAADKKKHGDTKASADWDDEASWLDKRAEKGAKGVAQATTKIAKKGVAEDDAGDVEQRFAIKMEKEKQRLAKLKQTDPEAYKREMEKCKTSSRIPPVSTFEDQGVAEGTLNEFYDEKAHKPEGGKLDRLVRKALANKVSVFAHIGGVRSGYVKSEDPVKGFLVIGSGKNKNYVTFDDETQKATMDAGRVYIQPRSEWNASRELDLDEGVAEDQLNELNRDTVTSYADKADKDQDKQFNTIGRGIRDNDPKSANKAGHKFSMRSIGINRAEKRLQKEDSVEEGLENILPKGTTVTVVHKGKQVDGKIVRYDAGKGGYSPAYVVDIGEYESIIVPVSKVKQGVSEGQLELDTIKRLLGK